MARNPEFAEQLAKEMREEGGFTVKWPRDIRVPGSGSQSVGPWVVSIGGQERTLPLDSPNLADTIDLYADNRERLLTDPRLWLRGWDSKGTAYLDVSRVFKEGEAGYKAATKFGAKSNQIALFDAGRFKEFPIGWPWEKALAGITPEDEKTAEPAGVES